MNKDEALMMAFTSITKVPTLTHGLLVKLADVEAAIKEALAQPEQYSDIISNGGLDPRNKFDAQPEQEPVAWLEPEWGEKICPEVGYEVTMTDDHPRDLCWIPLYAHPPQNTNETDEALTLSLAQPEQEPVAWMDEDGDVLSASIVDGKGLRNIPLYTSPPQRKWIGLTDEEISTIEDEYIVDYRIPAGSAWNFARDIEAKLKEKNT